MAVPPAKSWVSTLRLPVSTFPHRPSIRDRAVFAKRCTEELYAWQLQERRGSTPFVVHDGPPYANGVPHIGHAVNKILKDIICRAELAQGRRIQYVPGWDCHGLPIEIKALEQYRAGARAKTSLSAIDIRNIARSLATKTVQDQKNRFQDWAILADWKNAWTTMDKNFEVGQLRVFQEMVKRGLIFRRYKPVYWSPSSKTALAEAELEYKDDHESTAAFVKYSMLSVPQCLVDQGVDVKRLRALIWTTTPWTLPANRAIAVHPDLDYVVIEVGSEQLLVAESRLEYICELCSLDPKNTSVARFKGSLLEGTTYLSIFNGSASTPQPLILAEFVSADSGSGLVHCAPGHGVDDYEVCTKHGIAAFAPVDDAGCFTNLAFPDDPQALTGKSVLGDGNSKVLNLLGDKVLLVHKYTHKYPYDWRSKLPVIVRATEQWFAAVGSIKDDALASLEDVKFIPPSGEARLKAFILGRSEWCISRQRAWGVPIPALYDENGKAILTEQSVAHIISVITDRGTDAWWTDAEDDPAWIAPGLIGPYRRGKDTMDVWFDSGSSWTQIEGRADVYSEGTDQHRGWFQSSLLTYVSASGHREAPFRKLITHGFTLDQGGRKMSKSIGNVISPTQIIDGSLLPEVKYKDAKGQLITSHDGLGPDALRLWVASSDYTRDILIGKEMLASINTSLLKYRKVIRMLVGSMNENARSLPLTTLDKIALVQLDKAMVEVWKAWQTYEFQKAISTINRWVNVELSAFYLSAIKDRFYCGDGGGVLFHALNGFLQMLSPITPLLVEEAWEHCPEWMKKEPSILHPLQRILDPEHPLPIPRSLYQDVEPDIPHLLDANTAVKYAQEHARRHRLIGSSLQSSVILSFPDKESEAPFRKYKDELADILVTSSVEIGVMLPVKDMTASWKFDVTLGSSDDGGGSGVAVAWVLPPTGKKCPRCWRYVAPANDKLCKRCEDVLEHSRIDPYCV